MATGHERGVGRRSSTPAVSTGARAPAQPESRSLSAASSAFWRCPMGRRRAVWPARSASKPFQNEGRTCQPRELLLESQGKLPYHTGFS